MSERQLEIRHDDGTVTICDLDLRARTLSDAPQSEPVESASALDFAIARYDIESVVGRGGFATVVKAFDRHLGRVVALKIPRRNANGIRAEGELAAGLQHPNIVPIYDAGESEDGTPYCAMKLLDGSSLSEVLKRLARGDDATRERLSDARLLESFRQVCLAVQYAHDHGVLHRDIKPANIMLGEYGEVVLADWGIARQIDSDDDEGGLVRGTLSYMAPERLTDTPQGSVASDIYALGAVLYEILALTPVHRGTREEVLDAILDDEPLPPTARGRPVSPRLETICMSMLARDPQRRPHSAADIANDVAEYLDAQRDESARRRRAAKSFGAARAAFDAYQRSLVRMRNLGDEVERFEQELGNSTDRTRREELWRLKAEAADSRVQREVMFGRAVSAFEQVIHDDDEHTMARAGLAELHFERLREAETAGERVAAARSEQLLHATRFAPMIARLRASSTIRIMCSAPGATAALFEFVPMGPVLQLVDRVQQFGLPTVIELNPGSYALRVEHPGSVTMWRPFVVGRERLSVAVRVYGTQLVPAGFIVIHADDDDYALCEYPVTVAEFLAFVNSIAAAGEPVEDLLPAPLGGLSKFFVSRHGQWSLPDRDGDGDVWSPAWPMLLISRVVAERYAAWRAMETGLPIRLPTKQEWEWAARGPDQREYPWGPEPDISGANIRTNVSERAYPVPVGSFERDQSPFGVRDMCGGVSEWTSTVDERSQGGILMGASFNSQAVFAQSHVARNARPTEAFSSYGMRMCCTLGGR